MHEKSLPEENVPLGAVTRGGNHS